MFVGKNSHVIRHPRESVRERTHPPETRSALGGKNEKKKQFISCCAFGAFTSLFFVTCQLCSFFRSLFHNPHKECQSRSRIKCNPSNPPTRALPSSRYTFSLSFFLLFRRAFCFVSRSLFPFSPPSSSSFGSLSMMIFDYIFGYLFGLIAREKGNCCVVLLTLISLSSLSCVRIPVSSCANEYKQTAIFVQALVRVFSQNVRAEENLERQRG